MSRLIILSIFMLVVSTAYASEQLEEEVGRSIKDNEEMLQQDNEPEAEQLIIQQQEILKTLDDVDLFKSLEDARKALQEMKQQQRYVK